MKNWNEIRTAATVARLGTITAAADALGVHRATVIRHIDLLEQDFEQRLFIRAKNGYTSTDFGRQLLLAAEEASDHFNQLNRKARSGETLNPELVLSCADSLVPVLSPILAAYIRENPSAKIKYEVTPKLSLLEYGEDDIAFRFGPKPDMPDYVVERFTELEFSLFASDAYLQTHGHPDFEADLSQHIFISNYVPFLLKQPFLKWIEDNIPESCIRFRANKYGAVEQMVVAGMGIGMLACESANVLPDMTRLLPPRVDWSMPVWRATHVDLHRTKKIKRFLDTLKEHSPPPKT